MKLRFLVLVRYYKHSLLSAAVNMGQNTPGSNVKIWEINGSRQTEAADQNVKFIISLSWSSHLSVPDMGPVAWTVQNRNTKVWGFWLEELKKRVPKNQKLTMDTMRGRWVGKRHHRVICKPLGSASSCTRADITLNGIARTQNWADRPQLDSQTAHWVAIPGE